MRGRGKAPRFGEPLGTIDAGPCKQHERPPFRIGPDGGGEHGGMHHRVVLGGAGNEIVPLGIERGEPRGGRDLDANRAAHLQLGRQGFRQGILEQGRHCGHGSAPGTMAIVNRHRPFRFAPVLVWDIVGICDGLV